MQGDALSRHTSVLGDSGEQPWAQPAWGYPSVPPSPHQGKRFEGMWGTQIFTTCPSVCAEFGERALTGPQSDSSAANPLPRTRKALSTGCGSEHVLAARKDFSGSSSVSSQTVAGVLFKSFFFLHREECGVSFII